MTLKDIGLIAVCIPLIGLLWVFVIWLVFFLYYTLKEAEYQDKIAEQKFFDTFKDSGDKNEETT